MSRYLVFILVLLAASYVYCEESCPGRDLSPAKQCEDKGHDGLCKAADPAERCSSLKCTRTGRGDIPIYETYNVGGALQGTWCGPNKICIEGKCRDDPSPEHAAVKGEAEEYDCVDSD